MLWRILLHFNVVFYLNLEFVFFDMYILNKLLCICLLFPSVSFSELVLSDQADTIFYELENLPNNGSLNDVTNIINNVQNTSLNCTTAVGNFAIKLANFTQCVINHARPVRVCMNCKLTLDEVENYYHSLYSVSTACEQFLFQSDQIEIINLMHSVNHDMWTKNYCSNCYNQLNDTYKFFNVSSKLDLCMNSNNNTCHACHDLFFELNGIYKKFVVQQDNNNGVSGICMDIIDKMNITRHQWSKLKCIKFNANIGFPNLITAILVGTMPLFFYLLAKNISIIEDVKIIRPKRKSLANMVYEERS